MGLTAKFIENAKAGRHADGDGLYLLVKPTGARSWVLRVVQAGKGRRDIGLGAVELSPKRERGKSEIGDDLPLEQRNKLTLAEARELAARLRNVARAGRDPKGERDKDRSPPPTFKQAAVSTHEGLKNDWSKKTADSFLTTLEEYAYPVLGDMMVSEIDTKDVRAVLLPIWTTKPQMARKVRQRIGIVLNTAKADGWRKSEAPSRSLMLPKQDAGGNMAAMPYEAVPDYFADLKQQTETTGRLALGFVICTAARSGEVRHMRWGQIDWDKHLWARPKEMMKAAAAHTVTLNEQALAILRRAATYTDSEDPAALVFANRKGKPISDMTISKVLRDAGVPFVPHGFRSSFRDWAAEKMPKIPDAVAEKALAHAVPDKVERAYKRAQFMDMRRQLLAGWGRFIDGEKSNVVQLATRA